MHDRAHVEAFLAIGLSFIACYGTKTESIWNCDETGSIVGYLLNGTFLQAFNVMMLR
jgi:hypothetical protein